MLSIMDSWWGEGVKLKDQVYSIIDTETTGTDPSVDRVVEVGIVKLHWPDIYTALDEFVNPDMPIPPVASAVHHITDSMVRMSPMMDELMPRIHGVTDSTVYVAHHAKFDSSFLPLGGRWLCTYRLARHLWPEAPGHSNQVLRYWMGLDLPPLNTHRAKDDADVTVLILMKAIDKYLSLGHEDDVLAFLDYADSPIEVNVMPFGKHKGLPLKEMPRSYMEWALGNMDALDNDLRWSMEKALG